MLYPLVPADFFLIGIDIETGGFHFADNSIDSTIPEGKIGADHYAILEIGLFLLDPHLNRIGDKLNIIIHHSKEDLDKRVGDWSKDTFKDTLMIDCPASKIDLTMAEGIILGYLKKNNVPKGKCHLIGNSIDLDKLFIARQMQKLNHHLHYRGVDVSSFKVVFKGLFGDEADFEKKADHQALGDIEESIAELKFYIDKFVLNKQFSLNKK